LSALGPSAWWTRGIASIPSGAWPSSRTPNSRGDVYQQTAYNTRTAIRNKAYLHQEKTIYTLYGDLIGRVSLLVTGWILCSMLAKRLRGPELSP
jgi:hypothetical protein